MLDRFRGAVPEQEHAPLALLIVGILTVACGCAFFHAPAPAPVTLREVEDALRPGAPADPSWPTFFDASRRVQEIYHLVSDRDMRCVCDPQADVVKKQICPKTYALRELWRRFESYGDHEVRFDLCRTAGAPFDEAQTEVKCETGSEAPLRLRFLVLHGDNPWKVQLLLESIWSCRSRPIFVRHGDLSVVSPLVPQSPFLEYLQGHTVSPPQAPSCTAKPCKTPQE